MALVCLYLVSRVTVPRQNLKISTRGSDRLGEATTTFHLSQPIKASWWNFLFTLMHIPHHLISIHYDNSNENKMLNWQHRATTSINLWGLSHQLNHKGKGYPDGTVFEAWMDTPPLHSLGLTIEDQEQTDRLRLMEPTQGREKKKKTSSHVCCRCAPSTNVLNENLSQQELKNVDNRWKHQLNKSKCLCF